MFKALFYLYIQLQLEDDEQLYNIKNFQVVLAEKNTLQIKVYSVGIQIASPDHLYLYANG